MSGKYPAPSKSRVPWLSRFKKRASSAFAPSSSASDPSRLPSVADVPSHYVDIDIPPSPVAHHLSGSISSTSVPSTANTARAGSTLDPTYSTRHAGDSSCGNYSSTHLAPPTSPSLPQGLTSSYQGTSHMFNQAQNFVVKDTTFIENNIGGDNFMKELLQETIIGAEFDSSARDPPPRCHPGTRLAIIQRCIDFINQCDDEGKLRWVVGPAGVGKSAVMQMVTEKAPDAVVFASIFLSVNGRKDGKKAIITIAYQLAVKCGPYHRFIRDQISLDPSLLRKSLSVQFDKFIVEPFILNPIFEPSRRFLVAIDGLDECDDILTQRKLLELISNFCIEYPASPISWIVASRPEPHITSFFERAEVQPVYTKEEMVIDSDEACEEVQRYLRDELTKIKLDHATLRHKQEWPLEHDFTKISSAAGGLFAYAATVIRYIGDPTHGGPAAQLRRVLETIDATAKDHGAGRDHPMDRLDALYKRILSNVPDDDMVNTRKLLLLGFDLDFRNAGFRMRCNALELTEDDAYDAIRHLHAVMRIPEPNQADDKLSSYHKSFDDFLRDFKRSGFSHDLDSEFYKVCDHTAMRIIEELQDNFDSVAGDADIQFWGGVMNGHCRHVSLSWPADERFDVKDEQMRTELCTTAFRQLETGFSNRDSSLTKSLSCFHALTTRFTIPTFSFPFYQLRDCAFDQFRQELVKLGKLKEVPLRAFDYAAVCGDVALRFTAPTRSKSTIPDYWDTACQHARQDSDGLGQWQGWSTSFKHFSQVDSETHDTEDDEDSGLPRSHIAALRQVHQRWVTGHAKHLGRTAACIHCSRRFTRHFMNDLDLPAMVFVDSTEMCYAEVTVVDPDDGVSEWRYRFLHSGRPSTIDA